MSKEICAECNSDIKRFKCDECGHDLFAVVYHSEVQTLVIICEKCGFNEIQLHPVDLVKHSEIIDN
jgi:predicted RNA-binding Zn-ribbon protein involved in translation (DUF1610 family)